MITIKKAEDISEEKFIYPIEAFSLCDDEKPVTYCVYKIDGEKLEIYDIKGETEDIILVDALIRAVSSYGEGRGASLVICKNEGIASLLEKLGFKEDKPCMLCAETKFLLRHTCCGEV